MPKQGPNRNPLTPVSEARKSFIEGAIWYSIKNTPGVAAAEMERLLRVEAAVDAAIAYLKAGQPLMAHLVLLGAKEKLP